MKSTVAHFAAIMTGLTALAGAAGALTPEEVLVVVNGRVRESVELGEYYCQRRGVPQTNLVKLSCTEKDTVSDQEYRRHILDVLRKEIRQRDLDRQIRCVLLIRGVPFRAAATTAPAEIKLLADWSQRVAGRAHGRLATDVALLRLVGTHFPEKARSADSIERVGDWFDTPATLPEKLPPVGQLTEEFNSLLAEKARKLPELSDPQQRRIADRQMLALLFDAYGLSGLVQAAEQKLISGGPDTQALRQRTEALVLRQQELMSETPTEQGLEALESVVRVAGGAAGTYHMTAGRAAMFKHASDAVSLDSDLSLLWWDETKRHRYLQNLLHWQADAVRPAIEAAQGRVLMVARLDGPDWNALRRIIDDSLATEARGLEGTFYIDAGGRHPAYDEHLRALASMVRAQTNIPVVLDERPSLFAPDSCPDAALYVGWYSLKKYIPSCQWVRGAVGFHIASYEAQSLRDPQSTQWVPQMIQAGVAATLGPTDEPYLQAFPLPQEFFPLLLTGRLCLAEAYWRSVPHGAWRILLIGDPLYNPFRARPQPMTLPPGLLVAEK